MDDDTDHLSTMSHPNYPNIENIAIGIDGAVKLLNNISIHKASGPNKIPNITLTGLVLSSNGISLNTQLVVKVNILWCVNFCVVKFCVVKAS